VVLLIIGLRSLRTAPLDVFPEFAPPLVEIQTEAPGLSTEEVESLITIPLENILNGTAGVTTIRSKSVLGLSSVVMLFERGSDLIKARQLVQERLAVEARQLPSVARQPVILQPLSSTSRMMKIGLSSAKLSQRDLTQVTMWTIRPRLMAIPGVANVAVWGQRDRQFQVLVDPDRLRANGLTLDAVLKAAGDATVLDAGGFVDTPNQRLAVRQVSPVRDAYDLGRTVVDFRGGSPIRLSDVADVVIGSPPAIGDAVINDGPGLLLIVEKQPQANTLEVTHKVEKALEALAPGLKDVEVDPTIFRPATFIERALDNLTHALYVGCFLVAAILAVFLFDWRTALISLTAIPLSLIGAILVLTRAGVSINTMVLAGLVIALGEVVDDAIIDVENIIRRLRQNHAEGNPRSAYQVVLEASLEVRSSVVYASLIVVLVFLPIFFLEGLAGSFFRPLALSYVVAILASLLVALTVTPALSLLLLPGRASQRPDAPLTRWLRRMYRAVLPIFLNRPGWAALTLVVAFTLTGAAATRMGQSFLPDFQETDFLMHFVEKPGTNAAHHDPGQQGAACHPRCAQFRLAHRPGRGGRRGGRPQFHRAVDQHRARRGPQVNPGPHPGSGGRLSRAVSRRADLPEGAHQGGADRGGGERRGANLRPRSGGAARARQGGREGDGRDPGCDQPQGRAAGAGAADRGPAAARGSGALRTDPGPGSPGFHDAVARQQGG
jgi:Cu/Ag efflux pump CusA